MVDLLAEPVTDAGWTLSLTELVGQLRQEVADLRGEVASLRRENLELRQQAGYWKSRHADAVQRIVVLEQEVEHLRGENRKLQAQAFGRRSEKQAVGDRSSSLDDPAEAKSQRTRGQQPDRPGPRRRDYRHLPEREALRDVPKAERVCPYCGLPMVACGSEASEQLECETTIYRRVTRRLRYQRTCQCPGPRTLTASAEPKLLAKGLYGTSLWVEILVDKFYSYRSTERLLEQWRLSGLDLAAGTVADGLRRLERLFTPVYDALLTRNSQAVYKQADETRWFVFVAQEGKSNHCWWLWAFLGEDCIVYRLDPSRSHEVPENHYSADVEGVLMVDRLASYKAMAQVKHGKLELAFCWAHQRRDFVQVGKGWPELKEWAVDWLRRVRELYRCQRQRLAVLTKPAELAAAAAALRQAVETLRLQSETELADPQLRAPCRKVLESMRSHWRGLTLFMDDPRIPLDNNASERCVRGPALGRKNYYGSGSLWSGRLATMLFSIFATLKMGRLNPRKWLQWYLESCAQAGSEAPTDVAPFLPWNLAPERRQALKMDDNELVPDSS